MMVLAHQSGLVDVALFAIPAVLAIAALRWVESRARRRRAREAGGEPVENETE